MTEKRAWLLTGHQRFRTRHGIPTAMPSRTILQSNPTHIQRTTP